jgi:hypothetical protein
VHGSAVQARSIHGGVHISVGAGADLSVPGQLLPVPANFTSRSAELATLNELVTGDGQPGLLALAVVAGVGGVGKTSLVLRWLHEKSPNTHILTSLSDDSTPLESQGRAKSSVRPH